jgi:hypothetical protein
MLYREGILFDQWIQNDHEATGPDTGLQFGSDGRSMAKALAARGVIEEYVWGWTLEDVVDWLVDRGPVMLGSVWKDSMMNVSTEGIIRVDKTAPARGGHETCLRRVDKRRGLVLLLNSWGKHFNAKGWSLKGFDCDPGEGILAFEDLHYLLREGGDGLSFIEKKPV